MRICGKVTLSILNPHPSFLKKDSRQCCRQITRQGAGNKRPESELGQVFPPTGFEGRNAANLNTDRAEIGETAERKTDNSHRFF